MALPSSTMARPPSPDLTELSLALAEQQRLPDRHHATPPGAPRAAMRIATLPPQRRWRAQLPRQTALGGRAPVDLALRRSELPAHARQRRRQRIDRRSRLALARRVRA